MLPELSVGLVAAVVLSWDIWRPAPWMDELATLNSVRRDWGGLALLLSGPDAPLVPFYGVAKVWYAAGEQAPVSNWLWLRVLSLCCGIAVAVLTTACLRRLGTATAVTAGILLVTFADLTRQSQEARVNIWGALLACVSWMAWRALLHDPTRRRAAGYCAVVAVGAMLDVFLVAQVIVQIAAAAALMRSRRGGKIAAGAGGAGLLLVSPWLVWVAEHGVGPAARAPHSISVSRMARVLRLAVSADGMSTQASALLIGLILIGVADLLLNPRRREWALMLVCWALAGPLAIAAYSLVDPVVLQYRYSLTSLPAWAALAAAGVTAVARGVAMAVPDTSAGPRRFVTGAVASLAVFCVAVGQLPSQDAIRTPAGHRENLRPAVALVQTPRWDRLPLVPITAITALEFTTYAPGLDSRVVGWKLAPRPRVWLKSKPRRLARAVPPGQTMLLIARPLYVGSQRASRARAMRVARAALRLNFAGLGIRIRRVLLHRDAWVVATASRVARRQGSG